jgi:hypothetical protein
MIIAAAAVLIMTGCLKSTEPDINQNSNVPDLGKISISFGDAYGLMAAIKSVSIINVNGIDVPGEARVATAAFVSHPGAATNTDAGDVSLNSYALTKKDNKTYLLQDLKNQIGFGTLNWVVTGSDTVPAINYTVDKTLPDFTGYTSLPSSIKRSIGVTITLGSFVTNADSVIIAIIGIDGKSVIKRVAGNAAECAFGPADLNGLAAGEGVIQVAPWNYKKEDFNSHPYYFIQELAYTKLNVLIS